MAEPKKYDLMDLGGGINDTDDPTKIGDNECSNLENWFPFGQELRQRPGVSYVCEDAYSENVTGLVAFRTSTGGWLLIAGTRSGFAKKSGTGLVLIPLASGVSIAASDALWAMRQRNNVIYAAREGAGTLKRVDASSVMDAGIAAPSSAPTLADGGAGSLTAADYAGVVTFYNTVTGAESNPSAASSTLTLGASKKISWSGIPVSTNPQVNARRLYRTLPGQRGEYYLVDTIEDNTSTTYAADDIGTDDLGGPASFKNGTPPDIVRWCELFNERLWVTDGTYVYPSQNGLPEAFDEQDAIEVFTDDGGEIRVLHGPADRLYVGKTNLIAYITGTARSSFDRAVLTDRHGCVAPHSMKSAAGITIWYAGDNFYLTDGVNVDPISDRKIRTLLDNVPDDRKEQVCAAIFERLNLYVASIPQDSDSRNSVVVAYNYRTKAWTKFTYAFGDSDAPAVMADFYDEGYVRRLYAAFYDARVYDLMDEDALDDVGTAIVRKAKFKAFGFDTPNLKKGMRRLGLLCESVAANITARLYRDNAASAYSSRSVSLDQTREWKRLNLNSMLALAKNVAVELEYSGAARVNVNGLSFELVGFNRGGQPL